jgi:lipopolysaccharide transport system ATP-binding protein
MTRREIRRKFDEIVAFAEVEKFLDTPVKHYSSGMYVRLAFAVAAHLEPEILIVDEVLAVGDAEFQKKCLGKMDEASKREGRTVILVSHNMSAVNSLCSKGIYLEHGRLQTIGDTKAVVSKYLARTQEGKDGQKTLSDNQTRKSIFFKSVSILNHDHRVSTSLDVTQPFNICVQLVANKKIFGVQLVLTVETSDGTAVFSSSHIPTNDQSDTYCESQAETYYIEIPKMFLMPGSYFITLAAHTPMVEVHDLHQRILDFEIVDTGTAFAIHRNYKNIGIVIVDLPWRIAR